IQPLVDLDDDVTAAPAVAAVGAAEFDVFLAPEAHATGPAVAGAEVYLRLIEKLHPSDPNETGGNAVIPPSEPPSAGALPRRATRPAPPIRRPGPSPCGQRLPCLR